MAFGNNFGHGTNKAKNFGNNKPTSNFGINNPKNLNRAQKLTTTNFNNQIEKKQEELLEYAKVLIRSINRR